MDFVGPGIIFFFTRCNIEFGCGPNEWYNQRKSKKNQRELDYKHKITGEELWLNASDPLWGKKKVELLDSGLSRGSNNDMSSKSSAWVSDKRLIVRNPTVGLQLVPRDFDVDTSCPFRNSDIISMIPI